MTLSGQISNIALVIALTIAGFLCIKYAAMCLWRALSPSTGGDTDLTKLFFVAVGLIFAFMLIGDNIPQRQRQGGQQAMAPRPPPVQQHQEAQPSRTSSEGFLSGWDKPLSIQFRNIGQAAPQNWRPVQGGVPSQPGIASTPGH